MFDTFKHTIFSKMLRKTSNHNKISDENHFHSIISDENVMKSIILYYKLTDFMMYTVIFIPT